MKPLLIFGAGEMAEVAHHYFAREDGRAVSAFVVDAPERTTLLGTPVLALPEAAERFAPGTHEIYVAIGSSAVNRNRARKCAEMKSLGYALASYVSRKSHISTEHIGEHAFILEHNTIQPYTKIGSNVILWSGNHIGHHVTVEDHCFITSHVVVSGGTVIGEGSFLGVNATLRDHIRIGKHNVIGAGAVIQNDTNDHEVFAVQQTPRHPRLSHELSSI